jgi:hypothetical protein
MSETVVNTTTVTVESQTPPAPRERAVWKIASLMIAAVSAAGAVGWKVGNGSREAADKAGDTIAVSTVGQRGGLAAGKIEVNQETPPRTLNDAVKQQLKSMMPSASTVHITAVMGDTEAFQFATQIDDFLRSEGYKTDGVSQGLFSKPILGQSLDPKPDGSFAITIGSRTR